MAAGIASARAAEFADSSNAVLQYAEAYITTFGWKLFWLSKGTKEPLPGAHWRDDASSNITKLRATYKPGYNLALATGSKANRGSDVLVVDIDTKAGKAGAASLAALEAKYETILSGVSQITGSGGRQIFYRIPGDRKISGDLTGRLGENLDVKSDGGYVVLPPSRVNDPLHVAPYRWEPGYEPSGDNWHFVPEWLSELLLAPKQALTVIQGTAGETPPQRSLPLTDGVSHTRFLSHVGLMIQNGYRQDQAEAMALALNEVDGEPPWTEADVLALVNDCYGRYEMGDGLERYEDRRQNTEFIEQHRTAPPGDGEPGESPKSDARLLGLVSWAEVTATPDGEPLVAGYMDRGEQVMFLSKYGGGKSLVVLDLGLSVVTGEPWLDLLPVAAQGPVIYAVAEGWNTVKPRVEAWCAVRGVDPASLEDRIFFTRLPPNLGDRLWMTAMAREVKRTAAIMVIIDTLAAATPGADENSKQLGDMVTAASKWAHLPSRPVNVFAHHLGKDAARGSRGHTSIPGAVDTIYELRGPARAITISSEKQRTRADPDDLHVGIDAFVPVLRPHYFALGEIIHAAIEQSGGLPSEGIEAALRGWISRAIPSWRAPAGPKSNRSQGPSQSSLFEALKRLQEAGSLRFAKGVYSNIKEAPSLRFKGVNE